MRTSERIIPVAALGSNEGICRERAWDQSESAAPEGKSAGTETHRKMSKKGRRANSKKRPSEAPRSSGGLVIHSDPEPESAPIAEALEPPSSSAPTASLPPAPATEPATEPVAVAAEPPSATTPRQDDGTPGGAIVEASALDESFPPVEPPTDPHAELDHHFFDSHKVPDSVPPSVPPSFREPESTDPRIRRTHTPEAARRRAEFAKYVKIAVGVAAGVCLLAVGKVVLLQNAPGTAAHAEEQPAGLAAHPATMASSVVSEAPAPSAQAAPAAGQASAVPEQPSAASAPPEAPTVGEQASAVASAAPEVASAAASSAASSQPAASASGAAAAESAPDPKEAARLKRQAQRALDRGAFGQAIEAGEKSVGLDPTDGEAWLLLGAAYQEKGDIKNARRCYKSCIDQGKRGDKSECAAMLR
jgi:hypothetical protein